MCGHCAVEGSVLNVITCIYACAPPFPGGSHVVVLNVAVRNLENIGKMLSISRECQFPCGTVCATLLTQVRWLTLDDQLMNLLLFVATNFNRC